MSKKEIWSSLGMLLAILAFVITFDGGSSAPLAGNFAAYLENRINMEVLFFLLWISMVASFALWFRVSNKWLKAIIALILFIVIACLVILFPWGRIEVG